MKIKVYYQNMIFPKFLIAKLKISNPDSMEVKSIFRYTSFSFDTSQASNTQELTCTMEFCIFNDSDGSK